MKTNALLAFFFFFLVSLFASTRAEFVHDSEGQLVANGGQYLFAPQDYKRAVILGSTIVNSDGSCSLAVVEKLLPNTTSNSTIIETSGTVDYITTDYALQISFDPLPSNPCTKYPQWLVTMDPDFEQNAVMVGDPSEFPNSVSGRLYFKTYDPAKHHYTLDFCFDESRCGAVAVKTDDKYNRRLIVSGEQESVGPLVFKLVKKSGGRVDSHVSLVVLSNAHNN